MDTVSFEALLYQSESQTLDFKQDDYQLLAAPATGKKAALVIDILAFANAWRETTAYIVLGVSDKQTAPREVLGIPGGILARNLQQLVNGKTNNPVHFSYQEFPYQEKLVGIIAIPVQQRPTYLRDDFGQARGNVVYVRRGDTNAIASPDEAIRMAQAPLAPDSQPQLEAQFANSETHELLGSTVNILSSSLDLGHSRLTDYSTATRWGISSSSLENTGYYRDFFQFCYDKAFYHPVGFAITNNSGQVAHNVILRILISDSEIRVKLKDDIAREPSKTWDPGRILNFSERNGIEVSMRGMNHEVVVKVGTVQPGITEHSKEPIYFASLTSKALALDVYIAADNLMSPKLQSFSLIFETQNIEVDREKLLDVFDE